MHRCKNDWNVEKDVQKKKVIIKNGPKSRDDEDKSDEWKKIRERELQDSIRK